ncbi:hypothetical protein QWY86_11200 [Pedobacter aquatilis]|uniref:hypothetical protein n=1 Tax=Pedobacter aquatilis TaxID=351343 RepID=UPI0025B4CCED|nr:hypothetical protein [Pedobacter aquatilis]MDN3587238.1 hypothetical protein [Pedobacter aquatilis]
MHYNNKIPSVLVLIIILFTSISAKIEPTKIKKDETCDNVIKYYIKSGRENNKEFLVKAEITVNPINLITVNLEMPNEPKSKYDIILDSFDCNLNTDLTKGSALYKGYIKHENGDATSSVLKISRDEKGKLTISNADPLQTSDLILYVDKWEVFKN